MEFFKGFLSVSQVANFLNVSDRRVRTLLVQGRIDGFKDEFNTWHVKMPLNIKPGKRGPDLRGFASRRLQPRQLKVAR